MFSLTNNHILEGWRPTWSLTVVLSDNLMTFNAKSTEKKKQAEYINKVKLIASMLLKEECVGEG